MTEANGAGAEDQQRLADQHRDEDDDEDLVRPFAEPGDEQPAGDDHVEGEEDPAQDEHVALEPAAEAHAVCGWTARGKSADRWGGALNKLAYANLKGFESSSLPRVR